MRSGIWIAPPVQLRNLLSNLSVVSNSATPWTAALQDSLSFPVSQSLLKLMSIESVMPSNHLVLCHHLLLPSVFPSIGVFSSESALHIRWPKYWSFRISPFSDDSGLISFRLDWLDLLAVQGTLQHHSLEASVLQCSAFFGFPKWHGVKNLPANAGDVKDAGSTPGSGRSPGGRHGNPLW